MIQGKPRTLNITAGSFLGSLLLPLLPKDDPPIVSLPFESKRGRRFSDCFGFIFVGGIMMFVGLFISAVFCTVFGLHSLFYVMSASVFVGVAAYWNHVWPQFLEATYKQSVRVTESEVVRTRVTITGNVYERVIPIQEFSGVRWERHLLGKREVSDMQQFLNYVILIHPDRQESVNLYFGQTMQYIQVACQKWSEALQLPYLEPNELALDEYEMNQKVVEEYVQKAAAGQTAGVSIVYQKST